MPRAFISIITSGPLCQNPRPLKEALALDADDYEVTVIYPCFSRALSETDRRLCSASKIKLKPLFHTRTFIHRLTTAVARKAIRLKLELPSALGPVSALSAAAQSTPADLTLLHNEAPQQLAPALHKRGRRIAADFEDWYSEDLLPSARRHRPLRLLDATERFLLRHAAYTSTTSNSLSHALHARHGGTPPVVIPNTFPLQANPRDIAHRNEAPSFLWFSQTIGPGRGLEEFLAAWALTQAPSQVALLGNLSPGYDEQLLASLPAAHRKRLVFLSAVAPDELPRAIARHDLGLALEQNISPSRNLTITNKLFQYLNAGLALIATPTQGQREVFAEDSVIGLLDNLSNPSAFAARLDALLLSPTTINAMGAASRRLAEKKFCWEKTAPTLLSSVARALASPTGQTP